MHRESDTIDSRVAAIDTIGHRLASLLFSGKAARNNCKILRLLLKESPQTYFDIDKRLAHAESRDRRYSVAYGRVVALSDSGVLEKKGERCATKSKKSIPLWGLSSLGLWAAVYAPDQEIRALSLGQCKKGVMDGWKKFTEIYGLDKVERVYPEDLHTVFTDWLSSDDGLTDFLKEFGHYPLTGETAALVTFRRAIDLGLAELHGLPPRYVESWDEYYQTASNARDPYLALANIATEHPKLAKLHTTLRQVDAPLYRYLNQVARDEFARNLSMFLPKVIAERLADTPLLVFETAEGIKNLPARVSQDSLKKTLRRMERQVRHQLASRKWHPKGGYVIPPEPEIVIGKGQVSIVTWEPDIISPEWKKRCDLFVPREKGGKVWIERIKAG